MIFLKNKLIFEYYQKSQNRCNKNIKIGMNIYKIY